MESVQTKNCVLDKEAIDRKVKRMALEIAEQNIDEEELVIGGVVGNGEIVARCLVNELKKLKLIRVETITIQLNKKDPVRVSLEPAIDPENKVIILVDDVANTGKTLLYALKPFLDKHPKKIQTLVLVERSHKLFPIQTDYAGLSIATTFQEHIAVEAVKNELMGAWLY
jgi:pyrimidine operon attenuation protein/uracil phosphoribosyltransferase